MDALGSITGQKVLDDLTTMDGRAIPDDQQLAWDITQEMLKKADNTITPEGLLLHLHVQPVIGRDATNGRQMIVGQGVMQERCLAYGRMAPPDRRQEIESRFIDPHQCSLLGYGLFLTSGQRSSCQRAIASSSRWRTRQKGPLGLSERSRRKKECGKSQDPV